MNKNETRPFQQWTVQEVIEYGCGKFPDIKTRSLVSLSTNPYLDTKGVKSINKQIVTSFPIAAVDQDRFFRLAWLQYMNQPSEESNLGCSIERENGSWCLYKWKGKSGPRRAYSLFGLPMPTEFHAVVAACLIFANQKVPGDDE